jgi:hypothetical protein
MDVAQRRFWGAWVVWVTLSRRTRALVAVQQFAIVSLFTVIALALPVFTVPATAISLPAASSMCATGELQLLLAVFAFFMSPEPSSPMTVITYLNQLIIVSLFEQCLFRDEWISPHTLYKLNFHHL